ncbi:hypothetical protein KS4_20420 [Poriferisphaera corsica]|uniref:Helix-turn-helix domain-containing protein n=1 Tax=Poriferisphaera corsica TaxID=2528020 RepID=A0A517YV04_9BACT|nr:helix-turn-helix domain-containing protein [Poriferisphaera corsica]QDU33982.1 hypothetical protein KS4_20420 [Poriferisphaera corsica]
MAKMFYTLEETAAKLGVSEQEIKDMAASGKLQQFRDGDKLMFKCAEVDTMAGSSGKDDSAAPIPLADSQTNDAVSLHDTAIPLMGDTNAGTGLGLGSNDSTGISVFDAGEVDAADPLAQTVANQGSQISLESVGSGSGLLDLTHESNDASLGADLLEDIYPGSGDTAAGTNIDSAIGSSGIFDAGLSATGATSGLENLEGSMSGTMTPPSMNAPLAGADSGSGMVDLSDSFEAPSGFSTGMLFGTVISLAIALIVMVGAHADVLTMITGMLRNSRGAYEMGNTFYILTGGLFVLTLICGGIGAVLGKATS